MTYHGHIHNGQIIFDGPVALPEGAKVRVGVLETDASALDWLSQHTVDSDACPTDLAHQHDHYLYGTPKKEG